MTLSLRGRLLIGVMSLVVLGLLFSDVATDLLFQSSLLGRVDTELTARTSVEAAASVIRNDCRSGPGSATAFPVNTVVALLGPDGSVQLGCRATGGFGSTAANAAPVLPKNLHPTGNDQPVGPITVAGTGDVHEYRLTYWAENSFGGQTVVLAIPIDDVAATLSQLLRLELFISIAAVAATALLAWLIIQIGLRPLQRMGAAAGEIAAGDLSRRVEPATSRTEIGRLGLALNAMLSQIEAAFEQSKASEQRLRRFIADASHELRTPLTVIRGQLEVLAAQPNPTDEDVRHVERLVQAEIGRISRLVDDLLVLTQAGRVDFLRPEPVDLPSFVGELWDGLSLTADRRFELGPVPAGSLNADPDRLAQALRNLGRNAIDHTEQGAGLVRLDVERAGRDRVRFTVLDDGPGIPPEERERVFERFHRIDTGRSRKMGGAGLGLAIVRAIAEAHGGTVRAEARPEGTGARMELVLPGFRASAGAAGGDDASGADDRVRKPEMGNFPR
jgi:two-component system, OmpR family, sensor kinase